MVCSTNELNLAFEVLWLQLIFNDTVHYQNATKTMVELLQAIVTALLNVITFSAQLSCT